MVGSKRKSGGSPLSDRPFPDIRDAFGDCVWRLGHCRGLTVIDGLVMSGFIYSGAAQFVGLQLIVSHTSGCCAADHTAAQPTFLPLLHFFDR